MLSLWSDPEYRKSQELALKNRKKLSEKSKNKINILIINMLKCLKAAVTQG
jgi:hypothetical protein